MRILGFHHLAIFVRELERLALFYREVLGLSEMARHQREDGTLRSIWLAIPGGGFIALEENRGIEIVKQTDWTLYFDDPEGNHLALSHHPSPQTTTAE